MPAPDATSNERYQVPGLERGLRLLCEFRRGEQSLSAPELARRLDIPRSTVFRILNTLETLGFVERVDGSRNYRLGMAVLRLGFEYLATLELNEIGLPLLDRLREEIHFPCNLAVRDGRWVVYVARSDLPGAYVTSVRVGARFPAHATVVGRVLLEDMSLARLRELFPEETLEAYSDHTPKNTLELFDMVQEDRRRGYVLQEGFFDEGLCVVAAPVRDRTGNLIAALGVTMHRSQVDALELQAILRRVRETADNLSHLLGHVRPRCEPNVVNLWQR